MESRLLLLLSDNCDKILLQKEKKYMGDTGRAFAYKSDTDMV